jgi:hypothetical protein
MPMNPNQDPTPTCSTPIAPQRLLPHMDLVATSHVPMSDSSTISHLLKNLQSRKDLIKELLTDSNYHCDIIDCLATMKPPLIAQSSNRNSHINWMDSTNHYPVDDNAFSVYGRGTRVGQPRQNSQSEAKAKCYAMHNVIKLLLNVGTLEQQIWVLLHVLLHSKVLDIALSIGVHMSVIQMGQQVLWSAKKLIVRANDTDNKNFRFSSKKRAVVQALTIALLPTLNKDDSNEYRKQLILTRSLSKILGFSNSA